MQAFTLPTQQLPNDILKGQVILISGATRGLGREIALKLGEFGATLVLLGSNKKKLEGLYDEMTDKGFEEPALQPINYLGAGPNEMSSIADSVSKMFGHLDGVIHTAARVGQVCPVANLSPAKWLEAIHVNLNVPFLLTHALLPQLKKSQHPKILFTCDQFAAENNAHWSAYNASKQAMETFAQTLASELKGSNVSVNCLYPPQLRTAIKVNHFPGINPNQYTPPEDVAKYFVYLMYENNLAQGQKYSLSQ